MTKEDLKIKMANRLTNLIGRHISDGILPLSDKVVDAAIKIAEGYAKQESIEFAQWIFGYENISQAAKHFQVKTVDELYNQFLNDKNKQP